MNSLQEIAGVLRKCKRAVVCGHMMPDGDSIGSVLAMRLLLAEVGLETQVLTVIFTAFYRAWSILSHFPASMKNAI